MAILRIFSLRTIFQERPHFSDFPFDGLVRDPTSSAVVILCRRSPWDLCRSQCHCNSFFQYKLRFAFLLKSFLVLVLTEDFPESLIPLLTLLP